MTWWQASTVPESDESDEQFFNCFSFQCFVLFKINHIWWAALNVQFEMCSCSFNIFYHPVITMGKPKLNFGFNEKKHSTTWWFFQKAMFDCRRARPHRLCLWWVLHRPHQRGQRRTSLPRPNLLDFHHFLEGLLLGCCISWLEVHFGVAMVGGLFWGCKCWGMITTGLGWLQLLDIHTPTYGQW